MTEVFTPDYTHIVDAAYNREAERLPLYDHIVATEVMEALLNREFAALQNGDAAERAVFYATYCDFFKQMGYDTVSFEGCVGLVLPGGGALLNSTITPAISDWDDFNKYPWDEIPKLYFKQYQPHFEAFGKALPPGMKGIGGVGNGVFECVQDLVGFENLCYLSVDEPELYAALFQRVGDMLYAIWSRFLQEHGDSYCVLRFGDDLGYKSNTMLSAADIRTHIIPRYKRIIDLVHGCPKPFLLHSCGAIFEVMEDLIETAGIDAKHSNEDVIAPFPEWVEKYGGRIGNFGGIDTDAVCRLPEPDMRAYITEVVAKSRGHGGFAFGSGNSIPDYVPPQQYLTMNRIIREIRGA